MYISKALWEKVVAQWFEVHDMTSYCTFQGVVNLFPPKDVTNKSDSYVDVNYKDILVTFNVGKHGDAVLSKSFEIYNEYGVFIGVAEIDKVPNLSNNNIRVENYIEDAEVDWATEYGVYAINHETRLCENTSQLFGTSIVIYDSNDSKFDEGVVSRDLINAESEMDYFEDYDLYNSEHQLVGYAYTTTTRHTKKRKVR